MLPLAFGTHLVAAVQCERALKQKVLTSIGLAGSDNITIHMSLLSPEYESGVLLPTASAEQAHNKRGYDGYQHNCEEHNDDDNGDV